MMSTGEHEERAKGQPSGKEGKASPPPTDKVPEMPPEEWRNAGLNLLMLLAQAYYKLLELVIGVPCGAVDLDLNHSYLWTLKNIRNLLDNHPDLKDFPGPFEPVFPDLYPSTVRVLPASVHSACFFDFFGGRVPRDRMRRVKRMPAC